MKALEVDFAGVRFTNPVIVAAGSHTCDGLAMRRLGPSGAAGAVTKTISSDDPLPDPRPCYAKVNGGFINCASGSVIPAKAWFETDIAQAKESGLKVIANIAGRDVVDYSRRAEEAGADIIELGTYCSHLNEITTGLRPGTPAIPLKPHDPTAFAQRVQSVKAAVGVPVIVKLSAVLHFYAAEWAQAAVEAGADGISCADALGPVMAIDIKTGQPLLGGPFGGGGLTGPALKPVSLRMVFDIARAVKVPVMGVGGVSTWQDAVEYLMAGASLVGVCTAGHLGGRETYGRIAGGIQDFIKRQGYGSVRDVVGITHRRVAERLERGLAGITQPRPPKLDSSVCNGCGKCLRVCVHEAITDISDSGPQIDPQLCYGCGLCVTVCPSEALTLTYWG